VIILVGLLYFLLFVMFFLSIELCVGSDWS